MPILISFVLGILVMIPFLIAARSGGRKFHGIKSEQKTEGEPSEKAKISGWKKKKAPKVERVHAENETEYVPNQHLEDK